MDKPSRWKVNLLLLPLKIHLFVFSAALACALPFRTVYAKQLGVSATAVGVIFLAVPFIRAVTNPMFGFIMDYFKRYRLTLSCIMIVLAMSHIALLQVPYRIHKSNNFDLTKMLNVKLYYISEHLLLQRPYLYIHSELRTTSCDLGKFSCQMKCKFQETSHHNKTYSKLHFINIHERRNFSNVAFNNTFELSRCRMTAEVVNKTVNISGCDSCERLNVSISQKQSIEVLNISWNNTDSQDFNETESKSIWGGVKSNVHFEKPLQENCSEMLQQTTSAKSSKKCKLTVTQQYEFSDSGKDFKLINLSLGSHYECLAIECHNDTHLDDVESTDDNEFHSEQFWILFWMVALSALTFSAIIFLMDAICYEMLDNDNEKFGQQRLWFTIGWGVGSLVCGYIKDIQISEYMKTDYDIGFYLSAVLFLVDLIPIYHLKIANVKYSQNICKDVCLLLYNARIVIFIVMAYTIGVLSGLVWNYQFWFLEEIGASGLILGLNQVVECIVAEMPCFMISGWVIRKIGFFHCNSITLLCFGLRYICFIYMYDPWLSLPAGLLHGPTYGIFLAALTMYGKTEAPAGTEATVQAILSTAFEGIGAATGSILGGVSFDAFGSRKTFQYAAVISFILLGVNLLLHYMLFRNNRTTTKKSITIELQ